MLETKLIENSLGVGIMQYTSENADNPRIYILNQT